MIIREFRECIEKNYKLVPTGGGNSFGEILCYEIHINGLTFKMLAQKWNCSVKFLGQLIADHCERL